MNNPIKRIGLILGFLFLFPALFFTAIEINSINESERVLENIYSNQLETILLSVNRFSDDVLNSWANDLESKNAFNNSNSFSYQLEDFFKNKRSLQNIFLTDTSYSRFTFFNNNNASSKDEIVNLLKSNQNKIEKLYNYITSGYRKLEPLSNDSLGINCVVYIVEQNSRKFLLGFLINPDEFINSVLAPKIQEVARDDIVIRTIRTKDNNLIYTTDKFFNDKPTETQKEFWLFPNYQIGITLKGESLENIVKSRSYFNLSLLGGLNLLLLIAVIFLFRSIKKEIHLAQLKSEFVSNVSHELRTPLALISMFGETLELGRVKTEEKKNEYYKIISNEAQRLSKIVNSILNFSKMESGKRKYHLEPANLNEVIENVISTYKFHLDSRGFNIELNLTDKLRSSKIDKEAISECLINLIDNGIKYSKDEKKLLISSNQDDEFVYLSVTDFGIGISKEDQKKVFDKFYRVPSNLVHNTKGTGLGLSIVFQIINAHGGKIEVRSEIDKGSTFTLFFPIEK